MGKTILTSKQLDFLELINKEKQITDRFYLTGGTALSEFYLKHRLSLDLDFFSETEEVDPKIIEAFLHNISPTLDISRIKRSQFLGLFSYTLIYSNEEFLKVDFSYYPFPRIEKGGYYKNIPIASIYDIAVDKLHTIFMQPRARDYIDLYFIMQEKEYGLQNLILNAKAKFDWDIDPINLGSQFMRVKDLIDFPHMLKPFDKKEMEKFFFNLVKELEKEIFDR
ncbi:MAG: nucleotidyl transferase AbiEii/AbiGii toxin family protein [bacterium]